MVLKFENGSFVSVSEGQNKLGSMAVSLGSGPAPITTTVIPAKTDSLFLKLTAERISTTNRGISIMSSNMEQEIGSDVAKVLMTEITGMVRNV